MVKNTKSDQNKSKNLLLDEEAYGSSKKLLSDKANAFIQSYSLRQRKNDQDAFNKNAFNVEAPPYRFGFPVSFHRLGGEYYRVHKKLGGGTYGNVYLVENHQRLLALKVLKKAINPQHPLIQSEFKNEIKMLKKTGELIDSGITEEGSAYILSEFKHGIVVNKYIEKSLRNNAQVDDIDPLVACYEMAHGLRKLHDRRIVHCDLNPNNLLLVLKGKVVNSSTVDSASAVQLEPGVKGVDKDEPVGALLCMAPEILENTRNSELYTYYDRLQQLAYLLEQPVAAENSENVAIAAENSEKEERLSPFKITEKHQETLKALLKSGCQLLADEQVLIDMVSDAYFDQSLPDYQRNMLSIEQYVDFGYAWALKKLRGLLEAGVPAFDSLIRGHFQCSKRECYDNIVENLLLSSGEVSEKASKESLRSKIINYILNTHPDTREHHHLDSLREYMESARFSCCQRLAEYRKERERLTQEGKKILKELSFYDKNPPASYQKWLESQDVEDRVLNQTELPQAVRNALRGVVSRPRTAHYSYATDIYALGRTFQRMSPLIKNAEQKKAFDKLVAQTISLNADDRPNIDAVMLELKNIIVNTGQKFNFSHNRFISRISPDVARMLNLDDRYQDERLLLQFYHLVKTAKNETYAKVLYLEASHRFGEFNRLSERSAKELRNIFKLEETFKSTGTLPPDWQRPYKLCKNFIVPFRNALRAYKAGIVNWFRYSRDFYRQGEKLLETLKSTENLDQAKQMIADFANHLPPNEQRLKGLIVKSCKLIDRVKQKRAKVSNQHAAFYYNDFNNFALKSFKGSNFKFRPLDAKAFKEKIGTVLKTCSDYLASDEATLLEQKTRSASHMATWLDSWDDLEKMAMGVGSRSDVVLYAVQMMSFYYAPDGFARESVAVQFATIFVDGLGEPPDSISDRQLLVGEFQKALDSWMKQLTPLVNMSSAGSCSPGAA